jgi:hypothetical protein
MTGRRAQPPLNIGAYLTFVLRKKASEKIQSAVPLERQDNHWDARTPELLPSIKIYRSQ